MVLLHGFPELWRFWAPLMSRLENQFACAAPDLRGYGESDRPEDADDYGVDALLSDIDGLLDALSLSSVDLIGHDWGGVLAWWYAARRPKRVERLVVFNAPHPAALQHRLTSDPEQQRRSQYMTLLKQRDAAQILLQNGADVLWRRLRANAHGFDAADQAAYMAAWNASDALVGPAAWYRCSPFVESPDGALPSWVDAESFKVAAKTLIVWGLRDQAFVFELAAESCAYAEDASVVRLENVAHNPPREAPDACADLIRDFLRNDR